MQTKIQFADKLRGIAALSVVASHFLYGFFAYREEVARLVAAPVLSLSTPLVALQKSVLPEAFFGHFGVALFFLISGFVVPFALLDRSVPQFALGRLLRIWPTYAVGLTLTVALVLVSAWFFGMPRPFSWQTYGLQILMVRDLFWIPSIDGIVWTLEIEAKFYLLCMVMAPALRRGHPLPILAAGLALTLFAVGCASLVPGWLTTSGSLYSVLYALSLSAQMITFMLIGVVFNAHYRAVCPRRQLWARQACSLPQASCNGPSGSCTMPRGQGSSPTALPWHASFSPISPVSALPVPLRSSGFSPPSATRSMSFTGSVAM